MHRKETLATMLLAGAMSAAPALAQQTAPTQPQAPAAGKTAAPTQTAANTTAPTIESGRSTLNGTLIKTHDEWRASKVVGQTVYDENGQAIGTVDDLLLDDSGKVSQAVVSVGGFLGIGSKLVAIPYDQLKFEPNGNAASNGPNGNPAIGTTATGATTAATAVSDQNAGATPPNNAVASAPSRPNYFSVVMPGATKNTLTTMSDFRYAG